MQSSVSGFSEHSIYVQKNHLHAYLNAEKAFWSFRMSTLKYQFSSYHWYAKNAHTRVIDVKVALRGGGILMRNEKYCNLCIINDKRVNDVCSFNPYFQRSVFSSQQKKTFFCSIHTALWTRTTCGKEFLQLLGSHTCNIQSPYNNERNGRTEKSSCMR